MVNENCDAERIDKIFRPIEMLLRRMIVLLLALLLVFQVLVLSAVTRPYFSIVDRTEGESVSEIEIMPASQMIE